MIIYPIGYRVTIERLLNRE